MALSPPAYALDDSVPNMCTYVKQNPNISLPSGESYGKIV